MAEVKTINTATPNRLNTLEVEIGPETQMAKVAGLTDISVEISNEKEQYYTYDSVWQNTAVTAKSMTISIEGKRYKEDPAQNVLTDRMDKIGDEANIKFKYTDNAGGKTYTGLAAVSVEEFTGGDCNGLATLKATLDVIGAPEITPVA